MPSEKPVAVVSGASSGIGAASAKHLAAMGCDVAINYASNRAGAQRTADVCRELGVETILIQGDVGEDNDCRLIASKTLGKWHRLDVLVNNAGVTRFADASDLAGLDKADFEAIFATNVIGTYQLSRACAEALGASPNGSIVNVSSHSGMSGLGSSNAYSASKGALNTLTLSLARAMAPDVRVNAVCPGFVDTDWMAAKISDPQALNEFKQRTGQIAPLKRLVSAAEVAEAIGWFALGGFSVTGQLLVIDAGTHLSVGSPI